MGSSANLEVLPVELKRGILEKIADVKTLHSLIRASPRFFQIYRGSKEAIMSQIVHNQINPACLPIAFDVYYLRETKFRSTIRKLGVEYWNSSEKLHLCGPCSFPFATSRALISLHETIEYFISDFTENRLSIIEKCLGFKNAQPSSCGSTSKLRSPFGLSEIEHSRLARAFYHFELFTSLYRLCGWPICNAFGTQSITSRLLHMRPWELEEFYCVWSYFTEKRSAYVDQAERHLSQVSNETTTHRAKHLCPQQWFSGDMYLSPSSSPDAAPILHLERSIYLSLNTARAILNAKGPADKLDISRTDYFSHTEWILEVNMGGYYRIRWLLFPKYENCDFEDDIEKANNGMLWAFKDPNRPDDLSKVVRAGLRRWGYAIWDVKRLKNLGVLNRKVTEVSEILMRDLEKLFGQRLEKEE